MYICTGDLLPPSVLPRCRQLLSSHPNVALNFLCGNGGDGGGGVVMARWVALSVVVALAVAVSVALLVALMVGGGCGSDCCSGVGAGIGTGIGGGKVGVMARRRRKQNFGDPTLSSSHSSFGGRPPPWRARLL